jgi:hypothetical protein
MKELRIWITRYEEIDQNNKPFKWKMSGIGMDGHHGFGSLKNQVYNGDALLINSHICIKNPLEVSLVHYSRESYKWLVGIKTPLPDPPFLITNNLSTSVIFNDLIALSSEQDVIDTESQDGRFHSIDSNSWFGIATTESYGKVRLIAFSSDNQAEVHSGDCLYSPEYDCSMGEIIQLL